LTMSFRVSQMKDAEGVAHAAVPLA
jgi:hypothetical protein